LAWILEVECRDQPPEPAELSRHHAELDDFGVGEERAQAGEEGVVELAVGAIIARKRGGRRPYTRRRP